MLDYAMIQRPGQSESTRSVIVDISLGGVQTRSKQELQVGEICTLSIARGGEDPLDIEVEVRYCFKIEESDLFAVGFKFQPIEPEKRMELVNYIHDVFHKQGETLVN